MSVQPGDIKHYKSASNPANDDDTVGGAISASEVGGTIGEIFHVRTAPAGEEGETLYQYKKSFVANDNADTDLTNAVLFLANALDDVGAEGEGLVSATSTSADDDDTKYIRVIGEDDEDDVITEEIALDGTDEVTGASTFYKVFWVELRLVSSGALTTAAGDISIEVDGVEIGIIPAGQNCALGIVGIGLEDSLDDTNTTANAVTAPGGISFSKPRTAGTGLAVVNSGELSYGSAQGVWWKQAVEGGLVPAGDLTVCLDWEGNTT
jgi:hypothetical protein